MSQFAVLLAGPIEASARLRARLASRRVIAADAGIRHARALGLEPELWLGDFDSVDEPPKETDAAEIRSFPAGKDKTDGQLAIEAAIERGATSILLVGALGGPRSDHAFSHYVLAIALAEEGHAVEFDDGRERAWPLGRGETREVALEPGTQFSILRFSDVTGLTIEGAVYPLDGVDLPFTSILTQSNEAAGPIRVRIGTGRAILLAQADPSTH